jgi:ubiquinone/menaquinone biosynthesis C-methylase UbiE
MQRHGNILPLPYRRVQETEKQNLMQENVDTKVAEGFGDEWTRFDQSALSSSEKDKIFEEYFGIFPWHRLPPQAKGADFGCGSGRWASVIAPRIGALTCVDASDAALAVAKRNLASQPNCSFLHASVGDMPAIPDASLDFAYSLGVLHHIPDTASGIKSCTAKLKPGAPFLVYLYYSFDNRPIWFRLIWKTSELARFVVSRLPYLPRYLVSQLIAAIVYWPLARIARLVELAGMRVDSFPLSYYRSKTFYVMRTDALDRFGTRLEQRFSRAEIAAMMEAAGLTGIQFSPSTPHWCAVGIRKAD